MAERILVIDDEESIRFTFQYLLADQGYEVEVAATPHEAMELMSAGEFDLVFLDLLLGAHSGINTLKEIKQRAPFCPVIMITGAPDEETVSQAVRIGAFAYIPKPVRQEILSSITRKGLAYRQKLMQERH